MAAMTPEQIENVIRPHGRAELAMDMEGTMATVGPDPYCEFHPLGLALYGREPFQAQYRVLFDHILPNLVTYTERGRSYGDNFVVQEAVWRFNFDGKESDSYVTVVVSVDDRYVIGERSYASGPVVAVFERCFDEAFRALPGVVDLYATPSTSKTE